MTKLSLQEQVQRQLNSDLTPGKDYFEDPDVYENEILVGVKWKLTPYGHKLIDHHCPNKQGQLTVIIGHTNVGKSTLIIYLLSKLLGKKKLIIYSAENRISQIARLIISFFWGSHEYKKHFAWLRDRVLFIKHTKQYTYKDLLEQIAISDDIGFNADDILIDPYNALKVASKGNSHEYHYEAIEDMRIFTMSTGKSIFLNCHTVTESQRVKPNQYGEIPPPLMGDVEGGAKFPNKADDVWVLHRNLYHTDPDQRLVTNQYIGKVRNKEGGGEPTGWQTPIQWKFKKDWTGFTQDQDEISRNYEERNGVLIPLSEAIKKPYVDPEDRNGNDAPF